MTNKVRKPKTNTKTKLKLLPQEVSFIRRSHGLSTRIGKIAGYKGRSFVADILSGRRAPTERFLAAMQQAILEDAHDRTAVAMLARYSRASQLEMA